MTWIQAFTLSLGLFEETRFRGDDAILASVRSSYIGLFDRALADDDNDSRVSGLALNIAEAGTLSRRFYFQPITAPQSADQQQSHREQHPAPTAACLFRSASASGRSASSC